MKSKVYLICLDDADKKRLDKIIADAVRISGSDKIFKPIWLENKSVLGGYVFKATASQCVDVLANIYIMGDSTIYEKSLMYNIAKQCLGMPMSIKL